MSIKKTIKRIWDELGEVAEVGECTHGDVLALTHSLESRRTRRLSVLADQRRRVEAYIAERETAIDEAEQVRHDHKAAVCNAVADIRKLILAQADRDLQAADDQRDRTVAVLADEIKAAVTEVNRLDSQLELERA